MELPYLLVSIIILLHSVVKVTMILIVLNRWRVMEWTQQRGVVVSAIILLYTVVMVTAMLFR